MVDLINGTAKLDEIREVGIEDLLGRDPVQALPHLLEQCITDKSVMVTGAGGLIGSELCRQILAQAPCNLVLFEKSELALYQIEQELTALKAKLNFRTTLVAILGSGATEEICIPVLEKASGMKWKDDFFVGYSPERINPGDREHTLTRVVKVQTS